MWRSEVRIAGLALLSIGAVVLAGCTPGAGKPGPAARNDLAVVLVDPDGGAGTVVVQQGGRETVLHGPYAAAYIRGPGQVERARLSKTEVDRAFGPALAALPSRPATFLLYFVEGKDEFTEESKRLIDGVFAEIAKRPLPDVMVIGHTDKVGSDAVNDPLSRQRAEIVRSALLARGIAVDKVVAIGRGKREPIVPTADGVAEARNRRVEILVR